MRISTIISFLIAITFGLHQANSQRPGGQQIPAKASVQGRVVDATTGNPVEYANVVVYTARDSSIAYGGITDNQGYFKISQMHIGKYYAEVKFIGYEKASVPVFTLTPESPEVVLGKVMISPAIESLPEATVSAQEIPVEYHIDKKVVNVAQDATATGSTAVEVLENVPSVQTDIDGNVTLRGSGSFTVLVDGRPSVLQGTDALEQIPATTIDQIEIITNPSAKYDPDGVAGIINIILRKNKQKGLSGIVNLNAARGPSYGGDVQLSYRTGKVNIVGSASYNIRNRPGTQILERNTLFADTTLFFGKEMDRNRVHGGWNTRLGLEYLATPNDMLIFQVSASNRGFEMSMDAQNRYVINPGDIRTWDVNEASFEHSHLNGAASVYYEHRFSGSNHKIENYLRYDFGDEDDFDMNSIYETDDQWAVLDSNGSLQQTFEVGTEREIEYKTDYTYDLGGKGKLEAGVQARIENESSDYRLENFDHGNKSWVEDTALTNDMEFSWNIYSAYATYGGEKGRLGYKLGLRGEYVDRLIHQIDYDEEYVVNRLDYFPSVHMSYELNKTNQVMASYSRRIHRPRGWSLNPYPFKIDEYTVRVGNPALEPEYTNSFELSYIHRFKSSFVSLEAYRRETSNVMNRIMTYDTLTRIYTYTQYNLDRDYSTGIELSGNIELYRWFRVNVSGTYYNYRITGQLVESEVNQVTNTWRLNGGMTFMLPTATRIQLTSFYNAASVTAQGERDAFYGVNLAVRQDLLKRRLGVTLSIRDLFDTMEHSFTARGTNFDTYMVFDNLGPIYSINLSYRMNNYKQEERRQMNGNGGGDMEDIF